MTIKLSPDQEHASEKILESLGQGEETILVGPAGSGKTFLLKHIIKEFGRRPVIGCPTGKAAQRVHQMSGWRATTVHKLLYQSFEELPDGELLFLDPKKPCGSGELLVVDEASMLGRKIYRELMDWLPKGAPILFVGDKEQLEPVKDTWGPDLDNPTGILTQVHRQALDNPIIACATAIREGRGDAWMKAWDPALDSRVHFQHGFHQAIANHVAARKEGRDVTMLTYTHDVRQAANAAVREAMGSRGKLDVGDRIVIKSNTARRGLMNGEVLTITGLKRHTRWPSRVMVRVAGRESALCINEDFLEQKAGDYWNWLKAQPDHVQEEPFVHVWYGDCLTVHSAQGSQWDEVSFLWGRQFKRMRKWKKKKDETRRLLYTAVTRAAERLSIFAV